MTNQINESLCIRCINKDACKMYDENPPYITACYTFEKAKCTRADKLRSITNTEELVNEIYRLVKLGKSYSDSRLGLIDYLNQDAD